MPYIHSNEEESERRKPQLDPMESLKIEKQSSSNQTTTMIGVEYNRIEKETKRKKCNANERTNLDG